MCWNKTMQIIFFFKHKTAYEVRISDGSSDVCSSDRCVLARVADPCLMAQRLAGIDVFVDLGERHRGADVRLRLKRAPCAAVGADVLALGARLLAKRLEIGRAHV